MLTMEILDSGNCFHYLMYVQGFTVIRMTHQLVFRVHRLFVPWPFVYTRTTSIIEIKNHENEESKRWYVFKVPRVARHTTAFWQRCEKRPSEKVDSGRPGYLDLSLEKLKTSHFIILTWRWTTFQWNSTCNSLKVLSSSRYLVWTFRTN